MNVGISLVYTKNKNLMTTGIQKWLFLLHLSTFQYFISLTKALSECDQSVKSIGSDRQEWSYTLYDFEGQGHVTREVSSL